MRRRGLGKGGGKTAVACDALPAHPATSLPLPAPAPLQAYKLRQVQSTYIKPESQRLMLVLHVSAQRAHSLCMPRAGGVPACLPGIPVRAPARPPAAGALLSTASEVFRLVTLSLPCLQDVSSPIPADHISNTNPMHGSQLPAAAEAELLELHSKLAFHGRRLFRHEVRGWGVVVWGSWRCTRWNESSSCSCGGCTAPSPELHPTCLSTQVATTAWRLQFADHWQAHEAGGRAGDELRLAVAHLRAMLGDEDEIRWRRRGVQGLVS